MELLAAILTRNEERNIRACIESVAWTDAVLVVDCFSADATIALAQAAGARVIQHPWENYSAQRNVALAEARSAGYAAKWVLFIDADERATPELGAEIRQVIAAGTEVGWWIPRHNYIFGHLMRGTGWWPDYQLRLLRPDHATYDPQRAVHEEALLDGEAGRLQQPLIHYNYDTLEQFHAKQRRYTAYDVEILRQKGVRPHAYTPYTQVIRHFWWRFVTLQGWRDGLYGVRLSALMAYYEMLKYRQLRKVLAEGGQGGVPPGP
ncbi:MAG TPA: glycosyltransferase family 2 protein [Anaerolineae bacterium]|nr:glycosyltransferase family 2 protein [Anaerolineae bacterium]HRU94840.1 glycosyltransferase family 2 protein [Anaerolineae bacterium]HXK42375.1 glycosyltransferase family 2 protein [Anaerolineae bacterium]